MEPIQGDKRPINEADGTSEPVSLENGAPAEEPLGSPTKEHRPSSFPASNSTNVERQASNSVEDGGNIVWWDGPNDPENPFNWPGWKTVVNCGLISASTFITPLASSIFAPGVPQLMAEFQSDSSGLAAFVISVYILGFAIGPMLIAPLSEIYGRVIVYHCCNFGFLAFTIACATAPTLNALVGFRFAAGAFGSCPITNGGGSIADMVRQEKRGGAMAIFSVGPLVGPIIGPVAGGFLTAALSWRWTFWLLTILAGVVSVAELIFLRETYAPVLLRRKAERLRKETGNELLRSKLDKGVSTRQRFSHSIVRPLRMLVFSPIITITTVYIAIVYGYLYIMFTSITYVFEEYYGFSTRTVGLVFIGLGVGSLAGVAYFSMTSDSFIKKKRELARAAAEAAGEPIPDLIKPGEPIPDLIKPEYRLPPLLLASALLPAGFLVYGWSAQYRIHWFVPVFGTAIIGMGNILAFMALQLYIVDAFTLYAASALAANTLVRSIAGAVLPLCGLQMYEALGMGWGNTLLALVAVVMIPAVWLIIRYGEYLRTKFELKDI